MKRVLFLLRKGMVQLFLMAIIISLFCSACQNEITLEGKNNISYRTNSAKVANDTGRLEDDVLKIGFLNDYFYTSNQSHLMKMKQLIKTKFPTVKTTGCIIYDCNSKMFTIMIKELIDEEVDIVVIPNGVYLDEIKTLVSTYPEILFVMLDQFINKTNVIGCRFRDELGAYLAGVMAAIYKQK